MILLRVAITQFFKEKNKYRYFHKNDTDKNKLKKQKIINPFTNHTDHRSKQFLSSVYSWSTQYVLFLIFFFFWQYQYYY